MNVSRTDRRRQRPKLSPYTETILEDMLARDRRTLFLRTWCLACRRKTCNGIGAGDAA